MRERAFVVQNTGGFIGHEEEPLLMPALNFEPIALSADEEEDDHSISRLMPGAHEDVEEDVEEFDEGVVDVVPNTGLVLKTKRLNRSFDEMTPEDRRALAKMVFQGDGPDGKPFGIYVEPVDGNSRRQKAYRYTIRGHLIDVVGTLPLSGDAMDAVFSFGAPDAQKALLNGRGKSSCHSPGTAPPARRSS
jgi:hypothetical protein